MTTDPELVERCAAAVWHEWTGRQWDGIDEVNRKLSRSVARAVLAEADRPAPPIISLRVAGACPSCGTHNLMVRGWDHGHLSCTWAECPRPEAADEMLTRQGRADDPAVELLRELIELEDEPHPHGHSYDECSAYQDDYRLRHDHAWNRVHAFLAEIDKDKP